jgi:hypothetical protein
MFSISAFAQSPINCNFGDQSTPLDEIFEKDIAARTFTEKYPNATRYVAIEDSSPIDGEIRFTVENNNEKEVLLIKFNQNENGCYRPYAYHYSFDNGIIDVTVKNSIMNFGEIINLIKLDDKKIEDFYTKNCNPIQLNFVSNGESKPYFCKYDMGNSIEMLLQKHIGGTVEIHIPNKAMDALFYNCEIIDFIVLNNGEEIHYEIIDHTVKKSFKMDLPSGYNKIEIIGFSYLSGTDGFCGSIWGYDSRYISPLLQAKIGVEPLMIRCNDSLVLLQKYDGTPACVTPETKEKLIERGWTTKDYSILKTSINCMTLEQSKETAPFFKTPTYLPEGYFHVCSQSGTPFESYIVYHNQEILYWNIPELVSDGAIFIYQIDEKNIVGEEKFETLRTAEQRIQEDYDGVMKANPSLQPQLIRINGILAYAVDSCPDCGIQTANFTDGTFIQKSTSTETKIKFIDENGINYMLKTTLPLDELLLVAESLQ